jgi:hypothetical protein
MSAKVIRFLTLSTMFVQICISYSSFAEVVKVSGPMLPDAMDIVEEEKIVEKKPAITLQITPQSQLRPNTNMSIDPVCRGKYNNSQWYRQCDVLGAGTSTDALISNIRCEGFYFTKFAFSDLNATVSRRNVALLALSMVRNTQKPLSITPETNYKNIQIDLRSPMFPWTRPIIETNVDRSIVTMNRTAYEPARPVTRSEAFSLIMASVCMYPKSGSDIHWQKNVYDVAQQNGLTFRPWSSFEPNRNISVSELAVLVSRSADWAEKTGGCNLKPVQCVR